MDLPNDAEPLDLTSLRCFLEACGHRTFKDAASAVHLSPAAFGERLARLERRFGQQLFVRTTRGVEPTAAGHRLRPQAEALLEHERSVRATTFLGRPQPRPFKLTLGTRYELGLSWILPALTDLHRERPERTLHLTFGDTEMLLTRLEERRVDAFVSSARISESGLTYVPLHEETYVFVGAAAQHPHPLADAERVAALTLIDTREDLPLFRYFLDAVPAEPSWVFARHEYMGTIAAVRARVLAGHGVAVLPEYYVRGDLEAKTLVRLVPEVEPRTDVFRLIWRTKDPLESELRSLGEALTARPLS